VTIRPSDPEARPPGEDPNLDPEFVANHREDDGAHYLA